MGFELGTCYQMMSSQCGMCMLGAQPDIGSGRSQINTEPLELLEGSEYSNGLIQHSIDRNIGGLPEPNSVAHLSWLQFGVSHQSHASTKTPEQQPS
jgi:hypothetical protein